MRREVIGHINYIVEQTGTIQQCDVINDHSHNLYLLRNTEKRSHKFIKENHPTIEIENLNVIWELELFNETDEYGCTYSEYFEDRKELLKKLKEVN